MTYIEHRVRCTKAGVRPMTYAQFLKARDRIGV
jgi:hypothetical protein